MEIRLNNIGIVADSTIALNGLTVITGKNNSGKTTVGKTLYSLLDAVRNIHTKAQRDRWFYIRKQLENVRSKMDAFRFFRNLRSKYLEDLIPEFPALQTFIQRNAFLAIPDKDIENFAHTLLEELQSLEDSVLKEIIDTHLKESEKTFEYYSEIAVPNKFDESYVSRVFPKQRAEAISILVKLFEDMNKDMDLVDYTRESLNQTLRFEFCNQIQPVKLHTDKSDIELYDGEETFFKCTINNDKIVNDGKPIYMKSPFRQVFLIDDPFVLDEISMNAENVLRYTNRSFEEIDTDTASIMHRNRIYSHKEKLQIALRYFQKPSILEQTMLDNSLRAVKKQIDQIMPGSFEFSTNGDYYIHDGAKLKVSNLATGSKMFSIIKILLEKGEINDTTVLILDEPEAHLHPQWQNAFAETIVLLVKELNTNILLTTHSPNFMLAIDAYMRKYHIVERTNFYQTDFLDNGLIQYRCVNNDLGIIYQDFLEYLSQVKMLRNQYLSDTE
ncbi:MAG: ATP-binding protein [Lachnospiraceae bacterium]|jgi:predicted ATPase|nr:ATP-binding protein [Lachnospiraceae bacterium]